MSAATLLIADLHLDGARPDTLQAALDTFAAAAGAFQDLWILGDLFEAWIGDDAGLADPLGRRVADALAELSDTGTRVHLMHGNRDFLLGEAFAQAAGATLHREDELTVELAGQPVLLMHGDTLCSDDADYQGLRRQLRDPRWQAGFLALPIAERLAAAKRLRATSQEAGGRKSSRIMDVSARTVQARLQAAHAEHGTTTLVHGHTHRPATHDLTAQAPPYDATPIPAKRRVLGDWHAGGGQGLIADADGIRPVRCPAGIAPPSRGSDPAPPR